MRLINSISFIALFAILLLSVNGYVCSAQNSEIDEKIKKNLLERMPDVTVDRLAYKPWGAVWVFSKVLRNFEKHVWVRSSYTEQGDWKYDIWYLKKLRTPQPIIDIISEMGEEVNYTSYMENREGFKHYEVELKSGRYKLFDAKFNELEHGPLNDGIQLTDQLRKELNERLINPQILKAWKLDDDHFFLAVVFETENGHNNPGQIVFDKNLEWIKTVHYLKDYFRLPLELLMYVNDNGGLENFGDINKVVTRNEGTFYKVRLKDGQFFKLDENLNDL